MPGGWSQLEVERVVADYFAMLRAELAGRRYSKAEHRRRLLPLLDGRPEPSIEFKHANISAILLEMRLPYIDGYKPRSNYQSLLRAGVESFLREHPAVVSELRDSARLNPVAAGRPPAADVFVDAPEPSAEPGGRGVHTSPVRVDFALRDELNRRLGRLGEAWVLEVERARLRRQRRDDLARRVEWVADTYGDGLGYDIVSFNHDDGTERLVEVKTTALGRFFPFYVSANEVRVSAERPEAYQLYRVFAFGRSPQVFVLPGPIATTCRLEPTLFRAVV